MPKEEKHELKVDLSTQEGSDQLLNVAAAMLDETALDEAVIAAGEKIEGLGLSDTPLSEFDGEQFSEVVENACKAYTAKALENLYFIYGYNRNDPDQNLTQEK